MRILLDNAQGANWNEELPAPAYRNAPPEVLERVTELEVAAISGDEDLAELNRNSLGWRGEGLRFLARCAQWARRDAWLI